MSDKKKDPLENSRKRFREKLNNMSDESLQRGGQMARQALAEEKEIRYRVNEAAAKFLLGCIGFLVILCIILIVFYPQVIRNIYWIITH